MIAKLLWRLPAQAHDLIFRVTGGWVIVALKQDATKVIKENWRYRWEFWPGHKRALEYRNKPW